MSTRKSTFERLDEVIPAYQDKPASLAAPFTIGEMREIAARIAWLTDTVVMAAALWFEEIEDPRERDYASESLHELACDLVRENPRLKGGFKGDSL